MLATVTEVVQEIVHRIEGLTALELMELRMRLQRIWGDDPPDAGVREPVSPQPPNLNLTA